MCYRDPTGRRMFGKFELGGISQNDPVLTGVTFTVTEVGRKA